MNVLSLLLPALALLAAASSCSDRPTPAGQPTAPAAPAAAATPAPAAAPVPAPSAPAKRGDIEGSVRFTGARPPPLRTEAPGASPACRPALEQPRAVIGPDSGLAEVVVWIDGARGPLDAAPAPPALDQRDCAFRPRVVAAAKGAQLQVINSDPLLHNVHTGPGAAKPFNVAMPITGMKVQMPLSPAPEVTRVTCDVHPWMVAHVRTFDHPYFAVTDERGRFAIRGAPAGKATLRLWHPYLGDQRADVEIPEGAAARPQVDWASSP